MIIPSTHFSGMIPVFNTKLNKRTYMGKSWSLVYLMYSFSTSSDPGAFEFFNVWMHSKISAGVIGVFKNWSSSFKLIPFKIPSIASSSSGIWAEFSSWKKSCKLSIGGVFVFFRFIQAIQVFPIVFWWFFMHISKLCLLCVFIVANIFVHGGFIQLACIQ